MKWEIPPTCPDQIPSHASLRKHLGTAEHAFSHRKSRQIHLNECIPILGLATLLLLINEIKEGPPIGHLMPAMF